MKIPGRWYAKNSSKQFGASLQFTHATVFVEVDDGLDSEAGSATAQEYPIKTLNFSRRVGNIPRKIYFPDGSLFETNNNDDIDQWIQSHGLSISGGLVHAIESKWTWVGLCVVLCIGVILAFFRWGLPATTDVIASSLPQSISEHVSKGALTTLDRIMFEPSELPQSRKDHITQLFDQLLSDTQSLGGEEYAFALHFRKLGLPNALALPSGDIVVSDEFAELLENDKEIISVFLHEFGHVVEQHGLKQMIRSSILSIIFAIVLGDISGLEEIFSGLTSFLLQAQYSRLHETDADEFAFNKMIALNIDPIHFGNALAKLVSTTNTSTADGEEPSEGGKSSSAFNYLSTHPATRERIENANAYSKRYRQ